MSRSTPSLLALLGLVAVAGYQNRGRLSEMVSNAAGQPGGMAGTQGHSGGFLSQIGQMFQPGQSDGSVPHALSELVQRFKSAGKGDAADSWVSNHPNVAVHEDDMQAAIGDDLLAELSEKTGLSASELVQRLKVALPDAVNALTPEGRMPTADEARAQY